MIRVSTDISGMHAAVAHLKTDGVVAYPTETVYGLGVNPFSEQALDALFAVKQRDEGRPVLLIVDNLEQLDGVVSNMPETAMRCVNAFWPGPLSLLLPAARRLPTRLTDGNEHICVRCPDHAAARGLCRYWGGPITSTSANVSGHPPATAPEDAALPGVALLMDGGVLHSQMPSTVFEPESGRMLREGPITASMLEAAGVACMTRNTE